MDGREGERAGERLKRGKDGARRKKKRGKSGQREDKSGFLGLFLGACGSFGRVQLHDAQGWAFKWRINSV